MAISARIRARLEFIDAQGRPHAIGAALSDAPATVSAGDGDVHDQSFSVASGSTVKLWDASEDISTFDVAAVVADQDGQIQFVNNSGANFFTLQTRAGALMPIGGDSSLDSSGSKGAFDGTSDDIEEIHWKNTSSNAGHVRILAAT